MANETPEIPEIPKSDSEKPNPQTRGNSSKEPAARGPAFAATESEVEDLAAEIVSALPRRSGELIRCRRIAGNRYRCNWWGPQVTDDYDNPMMGGLMVTTHRVIRSEVLRATKSAKGLELDPDPRK